MVIKHEIEKNFPHVFFLSSDEFQIWDHFFKKKILEKYIRQNFPQFSEND